MDALVGRLTAQTSEGGLVVASKNRPLGEIVASRCVSSETLSDHRDWFEFLGLVKAEVQG